MQQALDCKASVTKERPVTSDAAATRVSAFLERHPELAAAAPDVAQQLGAVAEALAKAS